MAYAPFVLTYTPEPTRCSGGERAGTRVLQDWACDESPWAPHLSDLGIYACRDIFGGWCPDCDRDNLSSHASGGAGDSGHPTVAGHSHPAGIAFALWLVENHAVLGVQEVICNGRRWDNQTRRWHDYHGVSPHVDHVHWALNESGRRYLTLDRILSVAPQEDPMPALTDDEQRELLATSRALTKQLAKLRNTPQLAVIRRAGSRGMNTVSLGCGNTRLPLATQQVADQFKFVLGQATATSWPVPMFDALHVLDTTAP